MLPTGLPPAAQKQLINMLESRCGGEHARERLRQRVVGGSMSIINRVVGVRGRARCSALGDLGAGRCRKRQPAAGWARL